MNRAGAPAQSSDPASLVARIRAGDADADAELVERYSRGVRIIIGRIVSEDDAVADLCQETLRLSLEKIRRGEVREPERVSGFVCSIARNLANGSLRRIRPVGSLDDAEHLHTDGGPLDRLLENERVDAVRQVLGELRTRRDREILRRFYLEEEDKESICADLALSSLHFNRVLHRARERFKELYERHESR